MTQLTSSKSTNLVRLIYASQSRQEITGDVLKEILLKAREKNQSSSISGMLCFNKDYFLQVIEGSRLQINQLYNKLLSDDRHTNVQLIGFSEVSQRHWSKWTMAYATPTQKNSAIFLQYSISSEFNPYFLRAKSALMLLQDLAKQLETSENQEV